MIPRQGRRSIHRSATALVTTGALIAVAACGGAEDSDSDALVIGVRTHLQAEMEEIIEVYEDTDPGVDVELQTFPNETAEYTQRLATARLGEETPDIVENLIDLVEHLSSNNVTQDVTPYFEGEEGMDEEDFLPDFLDQYRPLDTPDEVHGMPMGADATVLFYNVDLFEEHGVEEPTDEWDWADFYAASSELAEACGGDCWGVGAGDFLFPHIYQPLITAYGGTVYDADANSVGIGQPEAIEAWEHLLEPFDDDSSVPYDLSAQSGNPSAVEFDSGNVGMAVQTRPMVARYRENMDADFNVVQVPALEDVRPVGGGSRGFSMTSTAQNPDAAWDFLSWLYEDGGGLDVLQETYVSVPSTTEGIDEGLWRDLDGPPADVEPFAEAARDPLLLVEPLPGQAQAVLDDAVIEAVEQVVLRDMPVEEAFQEAEDQVNEALDGEE